MRVQMIKGWANRLRRRKASYCCHIIDYLLTSQAWYVPQNIEFSIPQRAPTHWLLLFDSKMQEFPDFPLFSFRFPDFFPDHFGPLSFSLNFSLISRIVVTLLKVLYSTDDISTQLYSFSRMIIIPKYRPSKKKSPDLRKDYKKHLVAKHSRHKPRQQKWLKASMAEMWWVSMKKLMLSYSHINWTCYSFVHDQLNDFIQDWTLTLSIGYADVDIWNSSKN